VKKILYVNDHLQGGGTEIFTKQLAQAFLEMGFETFLATGDGNGNQIHAFKGLGFFLLRRTIFQNHDPLAERSFRHIVEKGKPDLIHTLNLYRISLSPVIVAAKLTIPCLMTICDYWPVCLNRGLLNPDSAEGKLCVDRSWKRCVGDCKHRKVGRFLSPFIERGMKHRVEILNNLIGEERVKILATSKAVADALGSFGLNRAMIDVIIPGVDPTLFRPGSKNREKIALFVGRPDPLKGPHIFSRIAQIVKAKIPDARFVAIGGYIPNSHVESLGKVDFDTLLSLYQSASCLCVPSIWPEPLGAIALEAMSCSTPVVAHRLGGLVETIVDGKTGFLVESGDINGFADKVSFLLQNQEERLKMGLMGRRRIEEKFDIKDTFKSYLAMYKRIARP